jgi:hypothetical protein
VVIDLGLAVTPIAADAGRGGFLSPDGWTSGVHPPLAEAGYVVEEFVVAGRARVFAADARAGDPRGAYATRVLAIRPREDAAFSGVVHLELLNPSTGEDFPMFWPDAGFHLMERGDAYLGITCKAVTAGHLSLRDPERYTGLRIEHDSVIWDLLGAVARATHEAAAGGLLPGLRTPARRFATGWSQSGSFLRTYLGDRIHQQHSEVVGGEIIDGYLIGVSSGGFGPMGYVELDRDGEMEFDEDLRPVAAATVPVAMTDARRVIHAPPVPVIEYMSEDEAVHHVWHRRPDSDVPGDRYRCFQIPGRGHETGMLATADRAAELDLTPDDLGDVVDPVRHDSSKWLIAATVHHLVAWADGVAPPRADPILVEVAAGRPLDPLGFDYSQVSIPRDANGYAFGGVRHLDADLPTARSEIDPSGPLTMRRWMRTPLPADVITARYGDRESYRELAAARAVELAAAGWLLPEDVGTAVGAAVDRYLRDLST